MPRTLILFALLLATSAHAQWTLLDSHSTADFRGVSSVGKGIVWASGTNGTVLRTEDGGYLWQHCTTPPGADKLDFRGIQAFDANTAIVMSSGTGDLSRLYKTTDGCQTWKLVLTNLDKDGFWDALQFRDHLYGVLLGDPVDGKFYARETLDGGEHWRTFFYDDTLKVISGSTGIFAASNSSLIIPTNSQSIFGIGNAGNSPMFFEADFASHPCHYTSSTSLKNCGKDFYWTSGELLPILRSGESSGVFSIAANPKMRSKPIKLVAVGGDYLKPADMGSAAFCIQNIKDQSEGAEEWPCTASTTPPHGYRSAVAYDTSTKTWITVGPNGTDISTDDGRNWRAIKPSTTEAPDADSHWNALSLPFVVGPHGRIGVLNPAALKTSNH